MTKRKNRRKEATSGLLQYAGIAFLVLIAAKFLYDQIYKRIEFGVPKINLGKVSWSDLSVAATINVPVSNNNPVSFPLDEFSAQVLYGQNILTSFTLTQPITIAATETTILVFETSLSFAGLAGNIVEIITSGEYLQTLRVKGVATSSGLTIPFENIISVG